jgi:glycosyltransferase involved in cell wall biosynthesis
MMDKEKISYISRREEWKFKKVIVVMPAYNAELTLEKTFRDIPKGTVDEVVLTDDCSSDKTVEIAKNLGITILYHNKNRGYGASQKTCYDAALKRGADAVVMIHPDYQYDSRLIPFSLGFLATGVCDVIIGSRIRTRREALDGGMPLYKYLSNRFLTIIENIVLGQNLGDFHSGFRVYTREVLETIPYKKNSNDFVFDTEFLAQAVYFGFRIGDIPIPTRYFKEASSINFARSIRYGVQTLLVMIKYIIQKIGLVHFRIFYLYSKKVCR